MNIGEVAKSIISFLFTDAAESIVTPLLGLVTAVTISPDKLIGMSFIDNLIPCTQKIAAAIIILNIGWQGIKSMVSPLGFEGEEPLNIFAKSFVAGFLILGIDEIFMKMVEYTTSFADIITNGTIEALDATPMIEIIVLLTSPGSSIIAGIIGFVLLFQIIVLTFRMYKRLVLAGILVLASPLACSAMVSKSTDSYFKGFIRVFVTNLIIQIVQTLCMAATITMLVNATTIGADAISLSSTMVYKLMLVIGMVGIINSLEDILRDISMGAGIGASGGLFGKMQSLAYTVSSIGRFAPIK